jgi:hypothetical protein
MPTISRGHRPILAPILLTVALTVAVACSATAAPSPSGPATSPSASDAPPLGLEPGGGSSGDPGSGIALPIDPTPIDPAAGQPTLVVPKPGRLNPHPVSPQTLQASVDGRHVLIKITWASGIAPCAVLDSVKVERSGTTIALTVIEGADQLDAVCAELAMFKATIVDLGELDAGTWKITAPNSEAAPIEVTIS